jgi:glycerophosphoryl diester phosphodiesterase
VESFQAAAASGLPWVELDVQRSADGELVVRHDPVTPAGDLIITRTAAQLAASGIRPLDEVLAALPAGLGVDIDVKTIIEDAADPPGRRTAAPRWRATGTPGRCWCRRLIPQCWCTCASARQCPATSPSAC